MQPIKNRSRMLPALFVLLTVVCGGVSLAQRNSTSVRETSPAIKINLSGSIQRPDGNVVIEKAGSVSPGEVINYTITSQNAGVTSMREYKAIGPIPARTVYVDGSAKAEGATALYSIDGSLTYSTQPMIEQTQPDGSVKSVPAPVSMYTHVRFEWSSPLAGDSNNSASYQVRVK